MIPKAIGRRSRATRARSAAPRLGGPVGSSTAQIVADAILRSRRLLPARRRLDRCERSRRLVPNLVAVDFYERSGVVDIARERNAR